MKCYPLVLVLLCALTLWWGQQASTKDASLNPSEAASLSAASSSRQEAEQGRQTTRTASAQRPHRSFQEGIQRVKDWLAAGEGRAPGGPMRPIPPKIDRDPALVPRHVPVDAAQAGALGALRWKVPGKHLEYRTSPDSRALTWLKGRVLEPAATESEPGMSRDETTSWRFLRNNVAALALGSAEEELAFLRASTDRTQRRQLRYQQRYQELDVWGREVLVQLDPHGNVELMVGGYVPSPEGVETEATLGQEAALTLAREHLEAPQAQVVDQELLVYAPDEGAHRLAYRCSLHASLVSHWDVFVDARNGEVLHQSSRVCTAHVVGSGVDSFGVTQSLNLWQHTDGNYYMVDTTKGMYDPTSQPPSFGAVRGGIFVRDANNAGSVDFRFNAPIIDEGAITTSSSANANSGWTAHAVDGAVNMGRVYEFFFQRFNRNSLDDRGLGLEALVNFPAQNAWKPFEGGRMIFGNQGNYPAALDVVSHEMTHGVVFYTSNLKYENQSGALNESISDILGEVCEAFFDPQKKNDWNLGTHLPAGNQRSFIDPSQQGNPSRFGQFVVTNQDAGGVHINSSITNHCFYQLAEGMPGAIGLEKATDIFYNGFTTKLVAFSKFEHARRACIQAAEERFGAGSTEAMKTAEAFDLVEIFDSTPIETSEIPQITGNDIAGFLFQSNGQTFVGRRDVSLGDDAAGVFLGANGQPTPALPGKRMSVSADGSLAAYVTPDFDAGFVNTLTGESTKLGFPGEIESVALSADGNVVAFVLRDAETAQATNLLMVVNLTTDAEQVFEARQPVRDQTGSGFIDTVQFLDTLELSPDGSRLYYDAVTDIFQAGFASSVWSMYSIRVSSGEISELFPANYQFNVGNPSLAQTKPHLMTFDVGNNTTGLTEIWVYDLASGVAQQLTTLAAPTSVGVGWPGYSGDDTAIIYTNYFFDQFAGGWFRYIESQPIEADGRTRRGNSFNWLSGSGDFGPGLGVIYRRGDYQGFQEVSVSATEPGAAEGGRNGVIRVERTGPADTAMTFDFVLTGSAEHGKDFETVSLSQEMAAGAASMDIVIRVVDDALVENQENVTLTLSENLHYTLGHASASVTIADNDGAAVGGYDQWAQENGVPANGFALDLDGDGFSNGAEYALGTNPNSAASAPEVNVERQGGQTFVEIRRVTRATGILYQPEVSTTLQGSSWQAGGNVVDDSETRLRIQIDPAAGERYLRLRMSRQ